MDPPVTQMAGMAIGGVAAGAADAPEKETAPISKEATCVITIDGARVQSVSRVPTWEDALRKSPGTEPDQAILRAVKRMKHGDWKTPTPIQEQMQLVFGSKRNFIGQAMGGQGKTGAFAAASFVVVDKAVRGPQVLVVEKTRNLVTQVRRPTPTCQPQPLPNSDPPHPPHTQTHAVHLRSQTLKVFEELAKLANEEAGAPADSPVWTVGPPMIGGTAKPSKLFQMYVGVPDKLLQVLPRECWKSLKLIVVDEADDLLDEGLGDFHCASFHSDSCRFPDRSPPTYPPTNTTFVCISFSDPQREQLSLASPASGRCTLPHISFSPRILKRGLCAAVCSELHLAGTESWRTRRLIISLQPISSPRTLRRLRECRISVYFWTATHSRHT